MRIADNVLDVRECQRRVDRDAVVRMPPAFECPLRVESGYAVPANHKES